MSVEIRCPACGREALLAKTPRYEGFRRTGETLSCSSCGHAFATEADVPFRKRAAPSIFADEDRSATPDVFKNDPRGRLCRYCRHYVVNPFRQWCGLHRREVEATETCSRFAARPPDDANPSVLLALNRTRSRRSGARSRSRESDGTGSRET